MCRETALSQIDAEPLCFCAQKRGKFCGFCGGLLRADHLPMPAAGVGRAQAGARGGGAGGNTHCFSHAYRVTDEDVQELLDGPFDEEQVFEAVVSGAVGAAMNRWQAFTSKQAEVTDAS